MEFVKWLKITYAHGWPQEVVKYASGIKNTKVAVTEVILGPCKRLFIILRSFA